MGTVVLGWVVKAKGANGKSHQVSRRYTSESAAHDLAALIRKGKEVQEVWVEAVYGYEEALGGDKGP